MFEKEADFAETKMLINCNGDYSKKKDYKKGWQDGAEFGYNKANEWHYVADDDLPKVDNKIVLCVCGDGYMDGKGHYILKLLTRKEFPLFQPVYAWKEIILPKESE